MDFNVNFEAKQMINALAKHKSVRVMFYVGIGSVYLYGIAALIAAAGFVVAAIIAAIRWW